MALPTDPPSGSPTNPPATSPAPPAGSGTVPPVVLPVPVAPTPTTASASQLYVTGSYTRSTTSPTGGAQTTTNGFDVTAGGRFASRLDANHNGIADSQGTGYIYLRQGAGRSEVGGGAEYRREFGGSDAFWSIKGEVGQSGGRLDGRVVAGVTIPFGPKPQPRREPSAVETAGKAFDDSLRKVYRSPEAVRNTVDTLDKRFDPAGLSFGQIAGALQHPEFLAGSRVGLTSKSQEDGGAAVRKTVDAYASLRQAEINTIRQAGPDRFDAAVRQQEAVMSGFQRTYGADWPKAYNDFRTSGTLPAGAPQELVAGAKAHLEAEKTLSPAVASAARDQAEINQYTRERPAPAEAQTRALAPGVQGPPAPSMVPGR